MKELHAHWVRAILATGILISATSANAVDVRRTARAGQMTRMWTYHSYTRQCTGNTGEVRVLTRPTHGTLINRVVDSAIKNDHWGDPHRCAGHRIKALAVFYTPKPGFRGTDSFAMHAVWAGGDHDTDRFTVTVE